MKFRFIGIAAVAIMAISTQVAYADDKPRSLSTADDKPRSLSTYFDNPMPSSQHDRINWALKARGEPPLGHPRN